ncbi:PLD nuclease N-terminal domain-containing protein [Nocardioides sp. W7]|uniref:PLD nuclease N-terminal domain-containing protein n=1 Tax=Nocardioides sp. W7 TaxID=2931390 RepID=UPI001FD23B7C|nr:PLD nuclease N-terminal domain-containing protein [Nocardioides sp. W7]
MLRFLPGLVVLVLWVYCLVDVIGTRDDSVRHLPKWAWIVLVLLFPFVGSVAWLLAGRPAKARPLTREQGAAPGFSEYERPGRFAAADPEKDEEFLRQVRERAEQQRRAYEEKKRREREEQDGAEEPGA